MSLELVKTLLTPPKPPVAELIERLNNTLDHVCVAVSPTSEESVRAMSRIQERMNAELPKAPVETHHVLHGGMYARTVRLVPDTLIVGCLYRVPTTLIVNGSALVFVGDEWVRVEGYNVFAASKGRKQMFMALGDVQITMLFRTDAKTVEEAESEMTEEAELLISRSGVNHYTVTGE